MDATRGEQSLASSVAKINIYAVFETIPTASEMSSVPMLKSQGTELAFVSHEISRQVGVACCGDSGEARAVDQSSTQTQPGS